MKSNASTAPFRYCVEIDIAEHRSAEWYAWMIQEHIPDVVATGCFSTAALMAIIEPTAAAGYRSFRTEYFYSSPEDFIRYTQEFADDLRLLHTEKFEGDFIARRQLIQIERFFPAS